MTGNKFCTLLLCFLCSNNRFVSYLVENKLRANPILVVLSDRRQVTSNRKIRADPVVRISSDKLDNTDSIKVLSHTRSRACSARASKVKM